jgi:hypothetical protein
MSQIKLLLTALCAIAASVVSAASTGPAMKRQQKRPPRKKSKARLATTSDEKLQGLLDLEMTSAEIAVGTGASVRAIEERRRRLHQTNRPGAARQAKLDDGIDALYSLAFMLQDRYTIPPHNVRAWFIGRSPYLDEQRPAQLLGAGEFALVREAAIAYAKNEAPEEFRDRVGVIVRVPDPLEA